MRKIWAKDSPQSELRISGNIRNGERVESENAETNRDRSNLGGALAPPTPWRPRTRGETLLPSREKVKEEEEGGGLSPPRFWWHRNTAGGHHHHRDLHQHLRHLHQHLHHLPPLYLQWSTLPQPAVPSTWTWCFMLHIIIQWCVAILWCLSRFSLSYRWLMNCYDWFELHVLLLVLSYGALRVAQAWGIPAVGCCNTFMIRL